ncbi:MAG: BatD family protein [Porticoccaceae bacterium]
MHIAKSLPLALWLMLLALFAALPAAAEELNARVDRTTIAANESLTLTLRYNGQTLGSPDFSALEKDFDILSSQRQQQLTMGFGNDSSSTDWVLTLMPKRTGTLVVPSLHYKNAVSDALTIEVTQAKVSSDSSQAVFMETEVDRDTVYVQGQVLLTLRLNTSVMLGSVDIPDLDIANARVIKIHDSQYQKTLNGREYIVVEMRYAIFPEIAGVLEIPALQVAAVVPDRSDPFAGRSLFGSRGKAVRLTSEAKAIKVLAIPATADGSAWIPARGLSISQRWSSKLDELVVGEPVTRSITLSAQGLPGAQLPPIPLADSADFRFYPDQPDISETLSPSGVLGARTESWAIVPTRAGTLTLPPVRVRWWDTEAAQFRETVLEGATVSVAPAPGGVGATLPQAVPDVAPDEQSESPAPPFGAGEAARYNRLLYGSLFANGVLLLLVLGLGLLLLRAPSVRPAVAPPRQDDATADTEKTAFKALTKIPASDLTALRAGILHWASLFWPDEGITTLGDIVQRSGDEKLRVLFADIDKALYGSGTAAPVDAPAIIAALKALRSRGAASSSPSALRPLYPV